MTISSISVSFIGTNCYFLKDDETGKGAVIDPGGDGAAILAAAERLGIAPPEAILLTHAHYDHTGAVAELLRAWPGVSVYLHPEDAKWTRAQPDLFPDIGPTVPYGEGDEVPVGNLRVRVLHTPGHTPGSVTLAVGDALFTGDTLFRGSCGRTDFPGGSTQQIMASLKRLAGLEGDLRVFPGHEGASTLEQERKQNVYMLQALRQ